MVFLGLLPPNIYNYVTIREIYKLMILQEPLYLCELLNLESMKLIKRNHRIYIPFFKLSQLQNNFCYQAPEIWNFLGSNSTIYNNVTSALPINSMKLWLKSFLFKVQSHGLNDDCDQNWYKFNFSIEAYVNLIKSIWNSNEFWLCSRIRASLLLLLQTTV